MLNASRETRQRLPCLIPLLVPQVKRDSATTLMPDRLRIQDIIMRKPGLCGQYMLRKRKAVTNQRLGRRLRGDPLLWSVGGVWLSGHLHSFS
jgi:hypothetical protein